MRPTGQCGATLVRRGPAVSGCIRKGQSQSAEVPKAGDLLFQKTPQTQKAARFTKVSVPFCTSDYFLFMKRCSKKVMD